MTRRRRWRKPWRRLRLGGGGSSMTSGTVDLILVLGAASVVALNGPAAGGSGAARPASGPAGSDAAGARGGADLGRSRDAAAAGDGLVRHQANTDERGGSAMAGLAGYLPALDDRAPMPGEPTPVVVRFRPRDGWSDVTPTAQLSVRFSDAMDRASTEAAFHATIAGTALGGSFRWAEADTVLVLRPAKPLPYSARVQLVVDATATSAAGVRLAAARSVTFAVAARPPAPAPRAAKSAAPTGSTWRWPLIGPITQYFGQSLTRYGYHQGIDIDGETGDPVVAARAGRVIVASDIGGCSGLQVQIDHGGGLVSVYHHLSATETQVGATVAAGELIGRVGNTGCSLGSHLHFGMRVDGAWVDPLRYVPPR